MIKDITLLDFPVGRHDDVLLLRRPLVSEDARQALCLPGALLLYISMYTCIESLLWIQDSYQSEDSNLMDRLNHKVTRLVHDPNSILSRNIYTSKITDRMWAVTPRVRG